MPTPFELEDDAPNVAAQPDPEIEAAFARAEASPEAKIAVRAQTPAVAAKRATAVPPRAKLAPPAAPQRAIAGQNGTAETVQPHNIDAEAGVLGCILLENGGEVLADCLKAGVSPSYFYQAPHHTVFAAMLAVHRDGKQIDEIVLAEKMKGQALDSIGGHGALYELSAKVQTTTRAKEWLRIVREKFFLRQLIRNGQWVVEQAMGAGAAPGTVGELVSGVQRAIDDIQHSIAGNGTGLRSLTSYAMREHNPDNLLGHGWLERNQSAIFISHAEQGKSSFILQAAAAWALGHSMLGLAAAMPLRVLVIQSEDSDDYIAHCWESLRQKWNLQLEAIADLTDRVMVVQVQGMDGEAFYATVKALAKKHRADLVILNPISCYIAGSLTKDEIATPFFNALERINDEKKWAYLLVQHTGKPAKEEKGVNRDAEWESIYKGFGSAVFANRPRAGLLLQPRKGERGRYYLHFGKAGSRSGVTHQVEHGAGTRAEPTMKLAIRWSGDKIKTPWGAERPMFVWELDEVEKATEDGADKPGRPPKFTDEEILRCYPNTKETAIDWPVIVRKACDKQNSELGMSPENFRLKMHRFLQEGKVVRLTNGKYYRA